MGLGDLFGRPLVDVIDAVDEPGLLAWRWPVAGRAIANGAQLTVREGQAAAFLDEGQIADIFGPGRHALDTATLPLLTALLNWDKGFASPFKSDVLFFSLREQTGRWGTAQPVAVHDRDLGPVRVRAHGRFGFAIRDVALFWRTLVGTVDRFTLADLEPQLRASILTALATRLGGGGTGFLAMAASQAALSEALLADLAPEFTRWGLALTGFWVESVSLPDAVSAGLDEGGASRARDAGTAADPFAQIERLHRLHAAGALTDVEFAASKAALLARIG